MKFLIIAFLLMFIMGAAYALAPGMIDVTGNINITLPVSDEPQVYEYSILFAPPAEEDMYTDAGTEEEEMPLEEEPEQYEEDPE